MNVEPSSTSVHPGQAAQYVISVSAENGAATDTTVQINLPPGQTTSGLPDPEFNVCGNGHGTEVCTLGSIRAGATVQVEAEDLVPSNAASGGTVTLAAKVSAAAVGADAAGTVTGSGTVSVAPNSTSSSGGHTGTGGKTSKPHPHSSSSSSESNSNTSGDTGGSTTGDNTPLDSLPPLGDSGSTSNGDSSNLFPTIGPSTGSSGGSQGKAAHKPYKATTVADILPLNTGQISGQVAGLIVLGIGIVLVFARISLRKPRSSENKN